MVKFLLSLFIVSILGTNTAAPPQAAAPQKIIKEMLTAIDGIKTLAYTLTNTERISGKYLTGQQFVKYQKTPFSVFIFLVHPSPGSKLLYVSGKNNNLAIYDPNGFPYIKMDLDPLGKLMLRNNHHSIFDIGFTYFAKILQQNMAEKELSMTYDKDTTWDDQPCYKITLENHHFDYYFYEVKKNENLSKVSTNLGVSLFMLKKLNNKYAADNLIQPGAKIKTPNSYAKKIILYINKKSKLPVCQEIYDNKGLYEAYRYKKIIVNPIFTTKDFDKSNLK